MSVSRFTETCLKGVGNMVFPIVFTCLAFTFNQVNSELGLIPFIIGKAAPLLSPALFPLIIFVILGFVAFLVGISWSLYLIAFPLVIPLAQALGADLVLAVAATVAAGTMGQHCCFYSDGTILVSASTGCDNIHHALSQLPYAMIAASLAGVAFLIAGVLSA
jgi:Na+/H+ antiporter NhaC